MTPMQRRAAAAGIVAAFAVPFEGLRQWAYVDPPGVLTVCYGTTGAHVERGRHYSLEECKAHLERDVRVAVEAVDRCVPGLPPKVLASFGDAAYNIGPRIACDTSSSTAARLLRQWQSNPQPQTLAQACAQHPRWNKARVAGQLVELPGLTRRTKAREQLCLQGVDEYQRSLLVEQHRGVGR